MPLLNAKNRDSGSVQIGSIRVTIDNPLTVQVTRLRTGTLFETSETIYISFSREVTGFTGATIDGGGSGRTIVYQPDLSQNASVYTLTVTPEDDTKGSITVTVPVGAATASDDNTVTLQNAASLTFDYDRTAPSVAITTVQNPRIETTRASINFTWTQDVGVSFTEGDITLIPNPDAGFGDPSIVDMSFAGAGNSYSIQVDIPDRTSGSFTIQVPADSATGQNMKTGPSPNAASATFNYNVQASTITTIPANLTISVPVNTPFRYSVAEIEFLWDQNVDHFEEMDITAATDTGTATISDFTRVGEISRNNQARWLYTINLTFSGEGTVTITVPANSAQSPNATADDSPTADVVASFMFNADASGIGLSGHDTIIFDETFDFTDDIFGSGLMGAPVCFSDTIVYNGNLYTTLQISRKDDNVDAPNTVNEPASILLEASLTTDTQTTKKVYDFAKMAARSPVIHDNELYFFEGDLWEGLNRTAGDHLNEMGYIQKIDSSGVINEVGLSWRSAFPQNTEQHITYGTHIGTFSPMLSANDELYFICGYGNPTNISDNEDVIARVDNMQWIKASTSFDFRLPLLETNEKTGRQVLQNLVRHIFCYQGFINNEFFVVPRAARQARLDQDIADMGAITSIDYDQNNRAFPASGLLLIGNELFSYENRTNTAFNSVQRSQFNTAAEANMQGADIFYVEEVFDLERLDIQIKNINEIQFDSDLSHVYNYITASYKADKPVIKDDPTSISIYRKREFPLNSLLYDRHQEEIVEWLTEQFIAESKDLHFTANIEIPGAYHLELGDVVTIAAGNLFRKCKVLRVNQKEKGLRTGLLLRTF